MAETPTPRTDAFEAVQAKRWTPHQKVPHMMEPYLLYARELEADLQHLARVAGEALEAALKKGSKWHPCDPTVVQMKTALSEITRIQNQTT